MKRHRRVLLAGLFVVAFVIALWTIQGGTKQEAVDASLVPKVAAAQKDRQRKERVFSEASACEISPSGLSQMQELCAQTLIQQRASTLKRKSSESFLQEIGICQFRYGDPIGEDAGWSLLTYDVQFGAGMGPSYNISEPSLPASTLGQKCEKFGEISFSCKFENDGKCSSVVVNEKKNFTGFECMDDVQY